MKDRRAPPGIKVGCYQKCECADAQMPSCEKLASLQLQHPIPRIPLFAGRGGCIGGLSFHMKMREVTFPHYGRYHYRAISLTASLTAADSSRYDATH